MTKEQITAWARESGTIINSPYLVPHDNMQLALERFAELVARTKEAEHKEAMRWDIHSCGPTCKRYACVATRAAVAAEREAICDIVDLELDGNGHAEAIKIAIRERGQATESSAVDGGRQTGLKQAETRVNIGFDGGGQNPKKELEHDNHGPQCSDEEMLLRGILASELRCWHRLTDDEAENLVAFVKSLPPKKPEPSKRVWGEA